MAASMHSMLSTVRSKGLAKYVERGRTILERYGISAAKMESTWRSLNQILAEYDCGATFPITACVVERHRTAIDRCTTPNVEFAVHGYRHINYLLVSVEEQVEHLQRASQAFAAAGMTPSGFRSPYLQFNAELRSAVECAGFGYVSNQPVLWDVVADETASSAARDSYARAVAFYRPWRAEEQLSLPRLYGRLVEIPVSLPDDEMLVERLGGASDGLVERAWSRIFCETFDRGELFTLQLHPERGLCCSAPLRSLLARARSFGSEVWVARLDQIATWWRARAVTRVTVETRSTGELSLSYAGPPGLNLLVRGVDVEGPSIPCQDGYRLCKTSPVILRSPIRPFISVAPGKALQQTELLRELGYLVETTDDPQSYSVHVDGELTPDSLRAWLDSIENQGTPLVKFARWPEGARSAFAITGDIDGLTVSDFVLRVLGY